MSEATATSGRLEYIDAAQLNDNPLNWKFHPPEQVEVITRSVERFGFLKPVATLNARTGRLIDGHARKGILTGQGPVPVWVVDIPEELEAEALATLDPSGWCSTPDKAKFADLLKKITMPTGAAGRLLENVKRSAQLLNKEADDERPDDEAKVEIPLDTIWPSDNVFGVPNLDASMAANSVPSPVYTWGSIGQTRHMPGTYHFYTHDYKFEPLWRKPGKVTLSGCSTVVEPNFSLTDQTALWLALYHIGRKRWMGRYWQARGLRLLVDLNVDASLNQPVEELGGIRPNLLGVPRGWNAYASRAHCNRPETLEVEYEVAREWSGGSAPLFFVVGGGHRVKALARDYGWIWTPEQVETALKREEDAA
jgi:hypothetical protein